MRVISGTAKGRILRSVPGPGTRPITDRAKSALFSILGNDLSGTTFLDLFAGTGQIGIEALSRGAERAVFVELGSAALRTIRENLRLTGLEARAEVVHQDVFAYLMRPPEPFDTVYVAPPQYREMWHQTLHLLDERPGWLDEHGWVIVQIHPVEFEERPLKTLTLFDQRKYGSVLLCFYRRREDEA